MSKKKVKVKSFIRKGKVVRSYDRSIKDRLIKAGSIIGGIGALGTGVYFLTKGKQPVINKLINEVSEVAVTKKPTLLSSVKIDEITQPTVSIVKEVPKSTVSKSTKTRIEYPERVARKVRTKSHKFKAVINSKSANKLTKQFETNLSKRTIEELNSGIDVAAQRIKELTKLSKSDVSEIGTYGKGRINKLIDRFTAIKTKLEKEVTNRNKSNNNLIKDVIDFAADKSRESNSRELKNKIIMGKIVVRRTKNNLPQTLKLTSKLAGRGSSRLLKIKKATDDFKLSRRDLLKLGTTKAIIKGKKTIATEINPLAKITRAYKAIKTDAIETQKLFDLLTNKSNQSVTRREFLNEAQKYFTDYLKRNPGKIASKTSKSIIKGLKGMGDPSSYVKDNLTPDQIDILTKVLLSFGNATGLFNNSSKLALFSNVKSRRTFFLTDTHIPKRSKLL